MIGVRFEAKLQKITNPVQLLVQSVYEVEHWIYYVFDSFHMIFAGRVSADDISGPVGIVTTIDQTVEQAAPAGNTVVAMVLVNFAILLSAKPGCDEPASTSCTGWRTSGISDHRGYTQKAY